MLGMVVSAFLYVLTAIAGVFVAILPSATLIPLPADFISSLDWFGGIVGTVAVFLPDGTLANLVGAITLIGTVNLIVLPFLSARHFRLPFAGLTKG